VNFTHLTALLPCRTLEEAGRVHAAEPAAEILSAWTALWHPTLVGAAGIMPHWAAAETPPDPPAGHLLLVPPAAEQLLPAGWLGQAEASGAVVLRNLRRRDEMLAAALRHVEGTQADIDPGLTADFLALGFCHLVVEMVTQQMRYMTSLDEASFERELLAAAEAATRGDADTARTKLQAAFDLLHTAREYYYPSESHLLDLTVVAETTLGASLRAALGAGSGEQEAGSREQGAGSKERGAVADPPPPTDRPLPTNLLLSGRVLEEMARREPESLALVRQAVEAGTAAVVGGEFDEVELPLLPLEAIRYQLEKGLAAYQRHLGRRPAVFGRRRFGMTPALPAVLHRLGFSGVLHATLDDGRFPADAPSRIRWEGLDGTAIETLLRVPMDINRPDAFLRLASDLSGSTAGDSAATAILAHWPGQTSTWSSDMQRIARHTTVLGTFVTANDYFDRGGYLGQHRRLKADEYRSPYLRQAVAGQAEDTRRDPISRWVRYFSRRAAGEAIQTLTTLARLVSPLRAPTEGRSGEAPASGYPGVRAGLEARAACGFATAASPLLAEIDDSLAHAPDAPALDERLGQEVERALTGFSRSVTRLAGRNSAGVLVANPWTFSHRFCLELPELAAAPDAVEPVRWAADSAGRKTVVVDVPPLGFAWIGPGGGTVAPEPPRRRWGLLRRAGCPRAAEPPPLAHLVAQLPTGALAGRLPSPSGRGTRNDHASRGARPGGEGAQRKTQPAPGPLGALLGNEFFEIHVDPHSGAIRSVFDYKSRGPRLAQQLAMRLPGASGDGDDAYSLMAADEVSVTSPGPVLGEVVARGRLLDRQGRRLAGFRQTTRIWRGSRVIELDIELQPDEPPGSDPWESYYASRLAWADHSASLYRSVNQAVLPSDAMQMEAPHLVDIRGDKTRTTLLCGGLPYHRRYGDRRLDTLLVVRGETCRRFHLGLGIDLVQPMAAATAFLGPRTVAAGWARPANAAGWLFHLDARGVLATHWEAVDGGQGAVESPRTASGGSAWEAPAGHPRAASPAGFRVRLLETEGRSIALGLRTLRTVRSAQKLGPPDEPPSDLPVEGDRIAISLGPHEWAEVEARW
jgi:alpha-mannosidase